jgi:hypothetical protein
MDVAVLEHDTADGDVLQKKTAVTVDGYATPFAVALAFDCFLENCSSFCTSSL